MPRPCIDNECSCDNESIRKAIRENKNPQNNPEMIFVSYGNCTVGEVTETGRLRNVILTRRDGRI